jgi:hypothetical protein
MIKHTLAAITYKPLLKSKIMTQIVCSKVKYLTIAFLFTICGLFSFGQNTRGISDIAAIVKKTDNLKSFGQYEFDSFNGVYKFLYDSVDKKLLKVSVKDHKTSQPKEYYFSNGELVFIKSSWGKSYFSDIDFSVGSTWKNENDSVLIGREREMAAAYRFLVLHEKKLSKL